MVLNVAHRGARSLAPENTLAAARKALEVGADMWELDVGASADGQLIVIHDDSLARTSNALAVYPSRAPWTFTTFTLAELRELDFGSWFVESDPFEQIAAGVVAAADLASYKGERIPTLREALLFTRDHHWQVNVEIKALPAPLADFPVVPAVVALIQELGMTSQVVVSSFVHEKVLETKRLCPAVRTAALVGIFGPHPTPIDPTLPVDGFNPWYSMVSNQEIAQLRRAGKMVIPWTVNDEAEMRRLVAAGVTGIITDYPQLLARIVKREA
ncbi:MAG: glycerophosphodiester phosphodiesterase family protein [Chloroflexota bacterium]